jgi:small redox-active disulfide protein 2
MIQIQVLGPGCPKCHQLAENAEAAVRELGIDAAVQRITDMRAIISLGVLTTPALVIDGQVETVGSLPDRDEIKKFLLARQLPPSPFSGEAQ